MRYPTLRCGLINDIVHPLMIAIMLLPCRWCINIAEAIAYLHSHKVIHRDLKPVSVTSNRLVVNGFRHLSTLWS